MPGFGNDAQSQQMLDPSQLHDFAVSAYRNKFGSDPTDQQLQNLGSAVGYTQGTSLSLADATRMINSPQALASVGNLNDDTRTQRLSPRTVTPGTPGNGPAGPSGSYVGDTYNNGVQNTGLTRSNNPGISGTPTNGGYTARPPTPTTLPTGGYGPHDPPPYLSNPTAGLLHASSADIGTTDPTTRVSDNGPFADWNIDNPSAGGPYGTNPPSGPVADQNPFGPQNIPIGSGGNGARPGNGASDDDVLRYLQSFAASHPNANPSISRDPNYWLTRMRQTNGNNIDWGYWEGRFTTPEGAPEGGGGPQNGSGSGGGGGNGGPSGTGFADPAYNDMINLVNQRLKDLQQPVSFPGLDSYVQMLQANQQAAKQRAQTFANQLTDRIGQLQQPLLTDSNVAQQRALASNSLLAQRDATLANNRERRFKSGFEPTSGLIAGDERSTNEQYNNRQASVDAQLQNAQIQGDEQRRNYATKLQGMVQQALQGGDVTALGEQATIADLENQMFSLNQNRQRETLTTGMLPVDLTNMGYDRAAGLANSGGDPLSTIMQLLTAANTQQGLQQNNSNSNWEALARLLQNLGNG